MKQATSNLVCSCTQTVSVAVDDEMIQGNNDEQELGQFVVT